MNAFSQFHRSLFSYIFRRAHKFELIRQLILYKNIPMHFQLAPLEIWDAFFFLVFSFSSFTNPYTQSDYNTIQK